MKQFKFLTTMLIFLFSITFVVPNYAVYAIQPDSKKEQEVAIKKKGNKIKNWIQKRISKSLQKKNASGEIKKKSKLALIFGIAGMAMLLFATFIGLQAGLAFLFIPTALLAVLGDIFAIVTLRNTKDNKEEYKKERKNAKIGLVLSLLVGLLPLALFIAVLVSLR